MQIYDQAIILTVTGSGASIWTAPWPWRGSASPPWVLGPRWRRTYPDVPRIHCQGNILMPGLINTHMHLGPVHPAGHGGQCLFCPGSPSASGRCREAIHRSSIWPAPGWEWRDAAQRHHHLCGVHDRGTLRHGGSCGCRGAQRHARHAQPDRHAAPGGDAAPALHDRGDRRRFRRRAGGKETL